MALYSEGRIAADLGTWCEHNCIQLPLLSHQYNTRSSSRAAGSIAFSSRNPSGMCLVFLGILSNFQEHAGNHSDSDNDEDGSSESPAAIAESSESSENDGLLSWVLSCPLDDINIICSFFLCTDDDSVSARPVRRNAIRVRQARRVAPPATRVTAVVSQRCGISEGTNNACEKGES